MAGEIQANSVVHQLRPPSVSLGKTCQEGFQSCSPNTCLGSAAKCKLQCPSALLTCCTKGTSSACESIFSHGYCLYKELRALPHVSIRFKLQRILYPNISPRFYCCASNACMGSVGKKRWKVAPEGPRTDEDELRARGEAAEEPRGLPGLCRGKAGTRRPRRASHPLVLRWGALFSSRLVIPPVVCGLINSRN